jgi:hypothetical protein
MSKDRAEVRTYENENLIRVSLPGWNMLIILCPIDISEKGVIEDHSIILGFLVSPL